MASLEDVIVSVLCMGSQNAQRSSKMMAGSEVKQNDFPWLEKCSHFIDLSRGWVRGQVNLITAGM